MTSRRNKFKQHFAARSINVRQGDTVFKFSEFFWDYIVLAVCQWKGSRSKKVIFKNWQRLFVGYSPIAPPSLNYSKYVEN